MNASKQFLLTASGTLLIPIRIRSIVLPYLLACCAVLVAGVPDARATDDLLIADFEGADYGPWKTTGNAFGQGPAMGKVADQGNVTGFHGKGLANSYPGHDGYGATGTLTSPSFKVERKYISFLIAGSTAESTALQLLIDGKVVASGSGLNDVHTRWVLFAGNARYAIGSFDGKTFTPEHPGKHQVHWGCYYASQTFDNAPNGRKIQMGWVRRGFGRPPWDQLFSFPHQLTLRQTDDGIRMFAKPVDEIEQLRVKSHKADAQDLVADRPVNLLVGSDLLDVRLTVEVGSAKEIVLNLAERQVVYSVTEQRFKGIPPDDRTGEPEIGQMKPINGKIDIQVLPDRGLTEIIGNQGRVFITTSGPAKQNTPKLSLVARDGSARLITLEAHELKSIWDK